MTETIVKPMKKVGKVRKTINKVRESPIKLKRWVILTTLSKLDKFLRRYGIINIPETDINDFLFETYQKPAIKWIISMIMTSIPICMGLILLWIIPPLRAVPVSAGVAIFWWLLVEFKRDWVKK